MTIFERKIFYLYILTNKLVAFISLHYFDGSLRSKCILDVLLLNLDLQLLRRGSIILNLVQVNLLAMAYVKVINEVYQPSNQPDDHQNYQYFVRSLI
jgi:hypothetical protein